MKHYILIISLVSLISCQYKNNYQTSQREVLPILEKIEHDSYSTEKVSFKPDTSINMISLINTKNIETLLGEDIMTKLHKDTNIPFIVILTKDCKQSLTLYFHPGGEKNEFSEFKISNFNEKDITDNILLNDKEFKTETGIKLKMTLGDFKSIKGKPDTIVTSHDKLIYKYEISQIEKSDFLKRYKMPKYYAEYLFINGFLGEFKFGFEYP